MVILPSLSSQDINPYGILLFPEPFALAYPPVEIYQILNMDPSDSKLSPQKEVFSWNSPFYFSHPRNVTSNSNIPSLFSTFIASRVRDQGRKVQFNRSSGQWVFGKRNTTVTHLFILNKVSWKLVAIWKFKIGVFINLVSERIMIRQRKGKRYFLCRWKNTIKLVSD